MSIQSEITRINTNISNAFDAVQAKGGTVPAQRTSQNLMGSIMTIPSGGGPSFPYLTVNSVDNNGEISSITYKGNSNNRIVPKNIMKEKYYLQTIVLEDVDEINDYAFQYCGTSDEIPFIITIPNTVYRIGYEGIRGQTYSSTVSSCGNFTFPTSIKYLGDRCFYGRRFGVITVPVNDELTVGIGTFQINYPTTAVYFTPQSSYTGNNIIISDSAFRGCSNLVDIYVPWSNGAVANAPWGATNATIHYNYSGV